MTKIESTIFNLFKKSMDSTGILIYETKPEYFLSLHLFFRSTNQHDVESGQNSGNRVAHKSISHFIVFS